MAETAFLNHPVLLPEEQEQRIVDFFENPYITVVPLDTWVCGATRKLVRKHQGSKIRAADFIHVATALHVGVPVLNSYDQRILKLDGQIEGLRTEEPTFEGDFPLLPDPTDVV